MWRLEGAGEVVKEWMRKRIFRMWINKKRGHDNNAWSCVYLVEPGFIF